MEHKNSYKNANSVYQLEAYETDTAKTTAIENIQKSLNTLGYTYGDEGELKIDGDFGVKTQTNWDNFISDLGATNYLSGLSAKLSNAYSPIVKNIANFAGDIKEDYDNYKSYKTDKGGYYNEDPQAVYDANYFSNYKGSFVLNSPVDTKGSFGLGPFIFMGTNSGNDGDKEIGESYEEHLDHEYGHNLVAQDKGILNFILNDGISSLNGYYNEVDEVYEDETYDENGELLDNSYYNQPWESDANKYGGNSYSIMNGENDFSEGKASDVYVNYYEKIKSLPIGAQIRDMLIKDVTDGKSLSEVKANISKVLDKIRMTPYETSIFIINALNDLMN